MPYHARLFGGAFSIASSTAPPHSPPRPSPWPKRQSASNNGAAKGMLPAVGRSGQATVGQAMRDSASPTGRRPVRMPKVRRASSVQVSASDQDDRNLGNVRGAAVDRDRKSKGL